MGSEFSNTPYEIETVTIASGQTESSAIKTLGRVIVGIITPAALTGTVFNFKISEDGTTYRDYYTTSNSLVAISVSTDRHIGILPSDFAGCRFLKIVSGSAEGDDREIKIQLRGTF